MVYFRFKILLMLGGQYDPSPAEMFQGDMTEWGGIYSCSRVLCRTTGCRPYHTAVWITRFALMCTALVTATEVTKPRGTMSPTSPKCLCQGSVQPQCATSGAKPPDRHRESSRTHGGGQTVQTELFTRFPASEERANRNTRNRIQSCPGEPAAGCAPVPLARTHGADTRQDTRTDGRAHTRPRTGPTRYGLLLFSATRHPREHHGNRLYIQRGTTQPFIAVSYIMDLMDRGERISCILVGPDLTDRRLLI